MILLHGWLDDKYKVHLKVTVTVVTLDKCHRLYWGRSTSQCVKSLSNYSTRRPSDESFSSGLHSRLNGSFDTFIIEVVWVHSLFLELIINESFVCYSRGHAVLFHMFLFDTASSYCRSRNTHNLTSTLICLVTIVISVPIWKMNSLDIFLS